MIPYQIVFIFLAEIYTYLLVIIFEFIFELCWKQNVKNYLCCPSILLFAYQKPTPSKSVCCCHWLVLSHLLALVRKMEKFQLFFPKGSQEVDVTLNSSFNLLVPPFYSWNKAFYWLLLKWSPVLFWGDFYDTLSLKILITRPVVELVKENIGNLKGYQYLY